MAWAFNPTVTPPPPPPCYQLALPGKYNKSLCFVNIMTHFDRVRYWQSLAQFALIIKPKQKCKNLPLLQNSLKNVSDYKAEIIL